MCVCVGGGGGGGFPTESDIILVRLHIIGIAIIEPYLVAYIKFTTCQIFLDMVTCTILHMHAFRFVLRMTL